MNENARPPGHDVDAPRALVIMGVSGSGKTTLAEALALRLGWRMLDAVGACIHARLGVGENIVAACSALKRAYRDRLRVAAPELVFVHLDIGREHLLERVRNRRGHFMAPSLLDDQLANLELPMGDEAAIRIEPLGPVAHTIERIVERLEIVR